MNGIIDVHVGQNRSSLMTLGKSNQATSPAPLDTASAYDGSYFSNSNLSVIKKLNLSMKYNNLIIVYWVETASINVPTQYYTQH